MAYVCCAGTLSSQAGAVTFPRSRATGRSVFLRFPHFFPQGPSVIQELPKDLVLVLSAWWAPSGLEMPNREWCWGCRCCKLRLVICAGHAFGPKAIFAFSVPRGPSFSVLRRPSVFYYAMAYVCCAGTLSSQAGAVTFPHSRATGRSVFFMVPSFFPPGVICHSGIAEGFGAGP